MMAENIIALVSVSVFVFIQFGLGCFYAGKMNARMTAGEIKISELDKGTVTKDSCKGINKQWDIKVTSLLEQRDIYNAQNSKEHNELLKQGREIVKCLNLLQSGEKC